MSTADGFKVAKEGVLLPPTPAHAGYLNAVSASFTHSLLLQLRRQRILLASGITMLPVIIPLAAAFLSKSHFADDGNTVFIRLSEQVYINFLTPLLAMFFATMLIGEEVESQTLPYTLTRPTPRSAWILGRYFSYVLVAACVLHTSQFFTFAACTTLSGLRFVPIDLQLLAEYIGVAFLGLLAYGALTMFIGAYFKRSTVVSIALLYGWQYIANLVPGVVDFLTIQKYTEALLPRLAQSRHNMEVRTALLSYNKEVFMVSATKAAITLGVVTVVCLALCLYTVRTREYAAARAAGG